MRVTLAVVAALVLAPAAAAWTPISTTPLQNIDALADGRVDVFLNDGHQLSHQTFPPGLSVTVTKKTATALDDGFGVKATLKGGGKTVVTSAAGKASLVKFKRQTRVVADAPGYAPASFRVP
jgi:hypothetical protein